MTLRISEADVVANIAGVLAKVREGAEVVVESNEQAVAVITPHKRPTKKLDEIVAEAKRRGCKATLDEEFGKDLEEIIASRQKPWNPPSWD